MPEALKVFVALAIGAVVLAVLWWLAQRPDYLDELPARAVPRERGIRGWYRTRSERRARALRREQLERREFQHDRTTLTGSDDPTDLLPRKRGH
jgi:hypothetical protein